MNAAMSPGSLDNGSRPSGMKRSFSSLDCTALWISPDRRATMSRGVPGGAAQPIQPPMSKPGRAAALASGATPGIAALPVAKLTPRGLRRPDFTCAAVAVTVSVRDLTIDQVRERGRASLVGHVARLDLRHRVEELDDEVRRGARA